MQNLVQKNTEVSDKLHVIQTALEKSEIELTDVQTYIETYKNAAIELNDNIIRLQNLKNQATLLEDQNNSLNH